jgi:hypothetical protein
VFFFPTAILEERESGNLALLQLTGLTGLQVVIGKGGTYLIIALMVLAVQFPFAILGVTLGGISRAQVAFAFEILAIWVVLAWSISLLVSLFAKYASQAALLTATSVIAVLWWSDIAALFCRFARIVPTISFSLPLTLTSQLACNLDFRTRSQLIDGAEWWYLLLAVVILALAAWIFRIQILRATGEAAVLVRGKREACESYGRVRPPPVAWKDFHYLLGGKAGLWVRWASAAALVGGGLLSKSPGWAIAAGCLGFIDCVTAAARSFGDEAEEGSPDLLLLLPHSGPFVVDQKLGVIQIKILVPWSIPLVLLSVNQLLPTLGWAVATVITVIGMMVVFLALTGVVCDVGAACLKNPRLGLVFGLIRAVLILGTLAIGSIPCSMLAPLIYTPGVILYHAHSRMRLYEEFEKVAGGRLA